MTDELIVELQQIKAHVLAEHGRTFLFADEHPEALQNLVDASITLSAHRTLGEVWALPAGWARIVNALHRDLLELLGEYVVTRADQKAGRLCFYTVPVAQGAVTERIERAVELSQRTCEVCGDPASTPSVFSTRCDRHPSVTGKRVLGALARPPGGDVS